VKAWIRNVVLAIPCVVIAGLLLLSIHPRPVKAGKPEIQTYALFGGSDVDSLEQPSAWFPVYGARRIIIKTHSDHTAFSGTEADTTLSDSIATWKTLFSDSMCCLVVGIDGRTRTSAADSLVITGTATDTTKNAGVYGVAVNKILRSPANGSGVMTVIYPVKRNSDGVAVPDDDGVITSEFCRIRVTPLRRNTITGGQSTAGKRVNGLAGLRMRAYVVYER